MKKLMRLLVVALVLVGTGAVAQQLDQPQKATVGSNFKYVRSVPSLAQQMADGTFKHAEKRDQPKDAPPKRRHTNKVVPGKGLPKGMDPLVQNQRSADKRYTKEPNLVFDAAVSSFGVSDPTGAAGPNHYIGAWNTAFRIFDKSGNPLTAEASLGTLFTGNTTGDPIVLYDPFNDRYIVTEFDGPQAGGDLNGFEVAVSMGPDPVNDGWHIYINSFAVGANFPDYTKFGIWGNGLYVTANIGGGNKVFIAEYEKMLEGEDAQLISFPLPGLVTSGFFSPQPFNVTGGDLPDEDAPGYFVYLQDDAWSGVTEDHLKIWSTEIDWDNPGDSEISNPQIIPTTPFTGVFDGGSFSNRPQGGGPDVDVLQATVMNQAQYRRFDGYNSVIFNFVVDVAGDTGEKAAIRWYELRQTGGDDEDWEIFQEGTYEAPDGRDAYSGSMVMTSDGKIGMAYTSSSATDRISIRYTGRFPDAPLGVMNVNEETIAISPNANPGNRLADYVHLTLDPVDESFWHIAEYFNPTRMNVVANFEITEPAADDLGVTAVTAPEDGVLGDDESVTIAIRNFGSNDITDPEVQYDVDGGTAVVETYSGTIAAGTTEEYTFTQTADLSTVGTTYTINAKTNLAGDSDISNDTFSQDVENAPQYCLPETTGGCNLDGIKQFILGDINVDDGAVGCNTEPDSSPTGYADRTDLSTDLARAEGENTYTIQAQQNWAPTTNPPFSPGDEGFAVWIDFDDSGTFDASELLIESAFQLSAELEEFTLTIPTDAALGAHTLRAKAIDITGTDNLTDPCQDNGFGEVQDYTVVIVENLGIDENVLQDAEFTVVNTGNDQFEISLRTSEEGFANFSVFDISGKQVVFNNLEKEGASYNYELDMSYAAAGVYIVKMEVANGASISKKIVVQ